MRDADPMDGRWRSTVRGPAPYKWSGLPLTAKALDRYDADRERGIAPLERDMVVMPSRAQRMAVGWGTNARPSDFGTDAFVGQREMRSKTEALLGKAVSNVLPTMREPPLGIVGNANCNFEAKGRDDAGWLQAVEASMVAHELPGSVSLSFYDPSGRQHSVRVDANSTTVASLKDKICSHTGIKPTQQRLLHNGNRIPSEADSQTLAQLGIRRDCDFSMLF